LEEANSLPLIKNPDVSTLEGLKKNFGSLASFF